MWIYICIQNLHFLVRNNLQKNISMKNLIFVSRSVIPSRRANTVNVLKMCDHFSKLGLNVKLYAKFRTNNYEYIKKYYSLESNIEIVDINTHVVNTVPILNQFVKILMYLYLSFISR